MSTETTPAPDDETRSHATEPAEGAAPGEAGETEDVRERPSDPAEGADDVA